MKKAKMPNLQEPKLKCSMCGGKLCYSNEGHPSLFLLKCKKCGQFQNNCGYRGIPHGCGDSGL